MGITLSAFACIMLALASNLFAGALLAFTIFFYVVIYTMWLKRWTPQNIVIGGAAGAFPPMIGWAVATGGVSIESVLMFTLTFMWTPPHFWALCLFMKSDYKDAGVPMLHVTHGRRATRKHILVYTILLAIVAIGMAFTGVGGPIYLTTALILNGLFLAGAVSIWRRDEATAEADSYNAKRAFRPVSAILVPALRRDPRRGHAGPYGLGDGKMSFRDDHELHKRRLGRNVGLALVLAGFIAIVFGLTVVKVTRGDYEPENAKVAN